MLSMTSVICVNLCNLWLFMNTPSPEGGATAQEAVNPLGYTTEPPQSPVFLQRKKCAQMKSKTEKMP
jgi:hypothetical protein